MVALGTGALELGAITPMFFAFREREKVLDVFEKVSGLRMNMAYVRPGGVAQDLPEGTVSHIRDLVKVLQHTDFRMEDYISEVDEELIAQVLSISTGIPVFKLTEEETARLLRMEDELHNRVIGQDQAISQQPSDTHAAGTVMLEHSVGYMLHDRVVRPSMVVVSTGPA